MLTSKERFWKSFRRQNVDRVVTDLWVYPYVDQEDGKNPSGITAQLMKTLGVNSFHQLYDVLGIDLYRVFPTPSPEKVAPYGDTIRYFVYHPEHTRGTTYTASLERPLATAEKPADVEKFPWPEPDIFDCTSIFRAREKHPQRILQIQPGTWSPIFCKICELIGMEQTLKNMILRPAVIEAMVDHLEHFYMESWKRILDETAHVVEIVQFGDDYASQESLLFSMELWRRYFKKPVAKLVELVRSYGLLVNFHCCGAMRPFIPELLDMGVEMIHPIQPSAKDMDFVQLKQEYGDRVMFYGGIDVQHVLPFGSAAQVRREVERVSKILGKGGGYVLASSHTLMEDVPVSNILAMYEEAQKCI